MVCSSLSLAQSPPIYNPMMTIHKYLLFPTYPPMMKSMLFGLSIRGKLVTCQYTLSEIRSSITRISASSSWFLADLRSFSRSSSHLLRDHDNYCVASASTLLHNTSTMLTRQDFLRLFLFCHQVSRSIFQYSLPPLFWWNITTFAVFTRAST